MDTGNLIFRRTWWLMLRLVLLHYERIAMVCYFRPAGKNLEDQGPLFRTLQKPAALWCPQCHTVVIPPGTDLAITATRQWPE
jgi:hypothetical protein